MANLPVSRSEIELAKERLRIPELWRILNLPGEPSTRDGIKFSSPLRPDVHPSCSFYDDCKRMVDWSTGKSYDAIDFLAEALGLRNGEVCGFLSWVLLDQSGLCAEARRLNREPYPPVIINGKVQLG